MAVNCPKCGKANADEAYICQYCDTPLVTYVAHPIPTEEAPPASTPEPTIQPDLEPEVQPDSPEWLEQLRLKKLRDEQKLGSDFFNRYGPIQTEPPKESPVEDTGSGLDDWLSKVRTNMVEETPAESEPTGEVTSIPGESSTNDWLTTIRTRASTDGFASPETPHTPDDADDWLHKLRKQTDRLKPPEENPEWMQALNEPHMPAPPFEGIAPTMDDLTDTFIDDEAEPEFMQHLNELPEIPQTQSGFDTRTSSAYLNQIREEPENPIPEQLRNSIPQIDAGDISDDFISSEEALLEMQDEPRERIPNKDIPTWLTSILGENEAEATPLAAISAAPVVPEPAPDFGTNPVEPGKIPGWVQAMRPIDATVPIPAETTGVDRHVEEEGPLAGIRGILSGEVLLPTYTSLSSLDIAANQGKTKQNVAFFNEILATETQTVKVPSYQRAKPGGTIRWLMMVFLITIMLMPLITGIQTNSLPGSIPKETANLFKAITTLPADAKVLLVVDYEPAYAGELQTASAPILNHLMVKQANLYVVSTSPTGPLLANQLLTNLANYPQTYQTDYLNGQKYSVLGYIPGEQAGILNLNTSLTQTIPLSLDLTKTTEINGLSGPSPISTFQAILLISDHPDSIRYWLEQVEQKPGNPAIWAVTNAQSAPQLRPYVRSGQLSGFSAGEYGGTVYERIFQQPGTAWRHWNVFYTGLLAAIILIIGGGVLNFLGQLLLKSRKKKAA
jgi:hypothetical protein